ncbi:MAG TPA: hypothetical protein VGF89_08630 [Steroidobacteraceae bacterium]
MSSLGPPPSEGPQPPDALEIDRRGFMKYLSASLALAGVSACSHPRQLEIVPYVHTPTGQIDGVPRYFASTLTRGGYGHGVVVESNMGRPTKIEGNPQHPASLGATDIFAQAAVLQLWDPERSQSVIHRGTTASWGDFDAALLQLMQRCQRDQGAGLHIVCGAFSSPLLAAELDALRERYPRMRCYLHEPAGQQNVHAGARLAFGQALSTRLYPDRARVIVALDADLLTDPSAGVRYARELIAARSPDRPGHSMSRLYAIEPTPSLTGALADHRLGIETAGLERFACRLARSLGVSIPADDAAVSRDAREAAWLKVLVSELQSNRGAGLVAVGATQKPWMHALAHALNGALGNVGSTLDYADPVEQLGAVDGGVIELAAALHAGAVETLLVLGGNPAYDAPADLQVRSALEQVPHLLHLGLYLDETGTLAEWHVPQAHELESWSDARAFDGTASLAQPLIAPLYGGRTSAQILALLLGQELGDGRALLRRQWQRELPDEAAWGAALQAGVIPESRFAARSVTLRDDWQSQLKLTPAPDETHLELLFRPDPTIGDGRWANNGWLQELPKPLSQLTWDNAACISPALAARYQLKNGDEVELMLQQRALRLPVWVLPGQSTQALTLHLGYGRRAAGRVGNGCGWDAYQLQVSDAPWCAAAGTLRKTGERRELAATQQHFRIEGRDLVRVGTLSQFAGDPHFATAPDRYRGAPPSLYPGVAGGEYAWGMSIDLNACIGCRACTIACQAENNIPVVGKEQVLRGREMHWIRVDLYREGSEDDPRTYPQPVPCMMCEHAPCELVCPVEASVHDSEGLNLQVYNRCVGTRFCSNNCPYKVRRFNFLQYVDESSEPLKAQRNPEVTVRQRGVMEKCTYCIQRIERAHIDADRDGRRIHDGEVQTACQAACPTQAIRFGNMADPNSEVAQAKASPRSYLLLPELNTRPRTSYLARVRNPHPDLEHG